MRADGELLAKSLPLASGAPRTAARRGGKLRLRFLSSFRCAHARRRRRVGSLFLLLGLGLRSRRVLPLLALASLHGEVSLARGRRVLQHVLEVVLSGQPLPVQHATVFAALLAAGKLARRIALGKTLSGASTLILTSLDMFLLMSLLAGMLLFLVTFLFLGVCLMDCGQCLEQE